MALTWGGAYPGTLPAAMRGAPVRAVASSTIAPFFALATKEPNIQALKGKIMGVSDFARLRSARMA